MARTADGGPLTRPPNGYVESKNGLEVVDAIAVAALDTDTRDVDGCAAPGDSAGDGYTAPGEPERNKGEQHLTLRRCPRHRKHTRRRVGVSPMPTADPAGLDADFMNAARDTGMSESSVCGTPEIGTVDAVPEVDGLKLGNEAETEMHDVWRDKTKASQSAGFSGSMEVERLRYAAEQAVGNQARPRSPIPTWRP